MDFIYDSIILSKKECNEIKKYILDNEEMVKSFGPDVYPGTEDNSLTGRWKIFNWLHTEVGDILVPKLTKI